VRFSSWLILNIPLATAAPRNNGFLTRAQRVVKKYFGMVMWFQTMECLLKPRWTVIPHPPYKLYIAPADFHLFGSLVDTMCGKSVIMVTCELIKDILLCY
jgi:hypothetical protein